MVEFKPILDPRVTHEYYTDFHPNFGYVSLPSFTNPSNLTKQVLPERFLEYYELIKNMETFEDDVFVCGHPKSGTHWLQEMVWLLNSDLNYDEASRIKIRNRYPFLERSGTMQSKSHVQESVRHVEEMSRPRHIKTHLIAELLPDQVWSKGSKIFFITRNPKDVASSLMHFSPVFLGYKGTREQLLDAFLEDQLPWGGFFDQLQGYWAKRDLPNVMFLQYEELKHDLRSVMRRVSSFLGKSYTEEQFNKLAEHLSIDSMRKNPSTNWEDVIQLSVEKHNIERKEDHELIRKGGTHKQDFSSETIARFDQWIQEKLKTTDFKFKS